MGDFYCYNNKLVSLEGSPQKVGGTFSCSDNQLVSLEGAPQRVGAILNCDPITLRGCPINLLNKIYFYGEGESIRLKNYIRETIDGLEATVYFKKMI